MIRLDRKPRPLPVVSIIPLVDVLLILLVFFMVTSTFLDLDMLPLVETGASSGQSVQDGSTMLLRLAPDGGLVARGQLIQPEDILSFFQSQSAANPRVLVLPSPSADVQALVRILDAAASTGLQSISVVQFGEGP